MRTRIFAATAFAALAFIAPALAADYQTNLGPMPLDDETKAVIAGRGDATASYDGKTFVGEGRLPRPAVQRHRARMSSLSRWRACPATKLFDLDVTKSTSGTISGSFS